MRVAIYFRITKTGEILRNGHTRRCVETTDLYEFSSITSAKEYAQKYSCNPLVWSDDGDMIFSTITVVGEKIEFTIFEQQLPEVLNSDSPLIDFSKTIDNRAFY